MRKRGRKRHFQPFSIHLSTHDCPNISSFRDIAANPPSQIYFVGKKSGNRGKYSNVLGEIPLPPPFHERAARPKRKGRPPFLKTEETEKVFLFLLFFSSSIAILLYKAGRRRGRKGEIDRYKGFLLFRGKCRAHV